MSSGETKQQTASKTGQNEEPPNTACNRRAPRSINWPVLVSKVRVSDPVFPDPRERVMLTLGAKPITQVAVSGV